MPTSLPRYRQVYETLRQQILDGLLLPGMRLPSSRVIAKQLGMARNTVIAAVEQLCVEGYAIARPKSGVYILSTAPINNAEKIISQTQPGLSIRGQTIAAQPQVQLKRGAFAAGVPDLKQFPFALWQRYISRYSRNPVLDWQAYPHKGGVIELRQTLASYLRVSRSISCEASRILITNGTQHSLQLIAALLADPGDRAWIEDPGYSGARCAFAAAGLNVISQPVDADGICPAANAWQQPPRLIYTTPSHQFPTGVVMSAARRRHLLAMASQHHTWVIEDDYDSEFRYEGMPVAALQALAPDQVIYLGTFSKIFFPAIRIGYMVLPAALVEPFRIMQARHQREPSYITQKALADFIRDGHASTHIRKMRRKYQARRDVLINLLQQELGNLVYLEGLDTGLHIVVYLPTSLNDQAIAAAAYEHGIRLSSLSHYATENTARPGLILGFGDVDQADILRAGKILCQLIKQAIE